MKKTNFEQQHETRWRDLETLLNQLENHKHGNTESGKLPGLFRQVCSDLSLAQYRMYGRRICDRLNHLVVRSYQHLHKGLGRSGNSVGEFAFVTFPQAVRREWRLVLVGLALFWVPFLALIVAAYYSPQWVFSLLSPEEVATMDSMYGSNAEPIDHFRKEYGSVGTSFMMFAFYVKHNIGIGLQSFGSGLLFVVGAAYELIWQGSKLGAMFGYVHYTGNEDKIWRFAISHSSFELTGLILCAVAGMRLGLGVLIPGRFSRRDSLVLSGKKALPILLGGAGMVFLAAIVEGFWSPTSWIPVEAKYTFGSIMWLVWLAYFIFCGRRHHA